MSLSRIIAFSLNDPWTALDLLIDLLHRFSSYSESFSFVSNSNSLIYRLCLAPFRKPPAVPLFFPPSEINGLAFSEILTRTFPASIRTDFTSTRGLPSIFTPESPNETLYLGPPALKRCIANLLRLPSLSFIPLGTLQDSASPSSNRRFSRCCRLLYLFRLYVLWSTSSQQAESPNVVGTLPISRSLIRVGPALFLGNPNSDVILFPTQWLQSPHPTFVRSRPL